MPEPRKRVRVLEVAVAPVVVIDHGDHLERVQHPVVTVPAEEWAAYSGERFPRELVEWEERLNVVPDGCEDAAMSSTPEA